MDLIIGELDMENLSRTLCKRCDIEMSKKSGISGYFRNNKWIRRTDRASNSLRGTRGWYCSPCWKLLGGQKE